MMASLSRLQEGGETKRIQSLAVSVGRDERKFDTATSIRQGIAGDID
jgi:hypothetical protein